MSNAGQNELSVRPSRRVTWYQWVIAIVLVAVAALLPLLIGASQLFLAVDLGINILLVFALLVVLGLGGYFSLGQGAFFAVGAYSVAAVSAHTSIDLTGSLGIAAVLGALAGTLMALTCLRTKALYLAMVTLAYTFILQNVAINWRSFTHGTQGIVGINPKILGMPFQANLLYWVTLAAVVITVVIMVSIRRGASGLSLSLTREHRLAAESTGIRTAQSMVVVFASSGAIAGVAGGLFAASVSVADPATLFDLSRTVSTLTYAVVGGLDSFIGSGGAAGVLTYVTDAGGSASWANWLPLIFTTVVIVVLLLTPRGIASVVARGWSLLPFNRSARDARRTLARDEDPASGRK